MVPSEAARGPAALFLAFMFAAACGSPEFDAAGAAWEQDRIDDACLAMIQNDVDTIGLTYSHMRNMTALTVYSSRFEGIEQGRFDDAVTLEVDGRAVAAPALGLFLADRPGYQFRFDVLPLVVSRAEGFRLLVRRGGQPIYSAALPGARDGFRRFRACAASLPAPGGS